MAFYAPVQGQVRTTSACAISFSVPTSQMRMSDHGYDGSQFEIPLLVAARPECPDIAPGQWTIMFDVRMTSNNKTFCNFYFSGGPTTIRPPHDAIIPNQERVVDFIVTSQNFSIKGCGYMKAGQWCSGGSAVRVKEIPFTTNEEKEKIRSTKPWVDIICSKNQDIEVELIFHVQRRESHQTQCLLALSSQLWNNRQLHTDCILVSRDGKEFPAHRFILASRSSVFAAMFEHEMEEKKTGICKIGDFDGSVVEMFLEFLYTGRADAERIKGIAETVYDAGDKYDVKDLCAACENIMVDNLGATTVLGYLNFAQTRGLDKLKVRAIKYMNANIGSKGVL